MHIAVLNVNVDRSALARGWPDDAEKVSTGLRPLCPGWHCRTGQACDGELPPEDDAAEAWVVTGCVASVNDEAPWMLALQQRVRARHAPRLPTAGIGFGHQLIAEARGGADPVRSPRRVRRPQRARSRHPPHLKAEQTP